MSFSLHGLQFGAHDLQFGVHGLHFDVNGLKFDVNGLQFGAHDLKFSGSPAYPLSWGVGSLFWPASGVPLVPSNFEQNSF